MLLLPCCPPAPNQIFCPPVSGPPSGTDDATYASADLDPLVGNTAITTERFPKAGIDPMVLKSSAEQKLKILGPLLAVFAIASSVYVGAIAMNWSWFSYHPLAMTVAYVALAGNAALLKKVGGKTNTEYHGYMMSAAMLLAMFGWYVIYTNKDKFAKPHNTTWHAYCGLACILGFAGMSPFSYFALNPNNGFARTDKTIRMVHKCGGRFLTALAWATCILGWMTMQSNLVARIAFGAPLVCMAPFVLL